MHTFLTRELIVAARQRALVAVMILSSALTAVFVLAWHEGLPGVASTLVEQTRIVECVILTACLPWAGVRCMPADCRDELAQLCTLTAQRPPTVVIAKLFATTTVFLVITLASAPVAVLSLQLSKAPPSVLVSYFGSLTGLAIMLAGLTLTCRLVFANSLAAWLAATVAAAVALAITGGAAIYRPGIAWVWLGVGSAAAVTTAAWSTRGAIYALEDR